MTQHVGVIKFVESEKSKVELPAQGTAVLTVSLGDSAHEGVEDLGLCHG